MYDITLLKEIPILEVLDYFNVEYRMAGSGRVDFLCPAHADRHLGSCKGNLGKNAWICYSCGAKGDVVDLAQAIIGGTFAEAKDALGDAFGIPKSDGKKSKAAKISRVRNDELRLLLGGIYDAQRAKVPMLYEEYSDNNYLCEYKTEAGISFAELKKEDPVLYKQIMKTGLDSSLQALEAGFKILALQLYEEKKESFESYGIKMSGETSTKTGDSVMKLIIKEILPIYKKERDYLIDIYNRAIK